MRKLRVKLRSQPALQVWRASTDKSKLVYILVTNKPLKYRYGRSYVAYIGTTKKGVKRIAASAAAKAEDALSLHGVDRIDARIVTCRPRKAVKTWIKLERALLLVFRGRYGEIPKFNTQGKRLKRTDEFDYFKTSALEGILEHFEP